MKDETTPIIAGTFEMETSHKMISKMDSTE